MVRLWINMYGVESAQGRVGQRQGAYDLMKVRREREKSLTRKGPEAHRLPYATSRRRRGRVGGEIHSLGFPRGAFDVMVRLPSVTCNVLRARS